MIYHHVFENPTANHFLVNKEGNCFFLHYARKGALQFHYKTLNSQLIPEEHFQVYYVSTPRQQFEFKQHGKYSLLSVSFNAKWLDPLKQHSRLIAEFLEKAKSKQPTSLFRRPQPLTVENKRLLNDVFSNTWSERHLELMTRLVILPALKRSVSVSGEPSSDTIYSVAEWILLHPDEPVTLPFLTHKFLINEFKLKSEFKKMFGTPVISFHRRVRIEKAKQMLGDEDISIYTIAKAVGFINSAYFSDFFKRETGYSPTDYRKKYQVNGTVSSDDQE
ncbi:MAG: helix-turn-helix transcriptional regulator [Chitinophagaceae bacterium]|nr:helix-turn-helix transcriptional regulator [Chitinophagaceae bacterium]